MRPSVVRPYGYAYVVDRRCRLPSVSSYPRSVIR